MRYLYALALSVPLVTALSVHQGCGSGEDTVAGPGTAANGTGASAASGGVGHGGSAAAGAVGGGGGTGASGLVGGGGNGTGADAGVFDADFGYDAPAFDAGLEDACVDETAAADPVPLDIYFMLDRSGSMGTDCNVSWPNNPSASSKWCYAINAIAGYSQDAQSDGNRAALEFFSGSISEQCNGSAYATPAVNLINLTAQAGQLTTAMNGQSPTGTTPTEAALRGLASFTAANQTPGRVIIGILITDGDPCCGACNENDSTLGSIVQNHYNATGIHTFIVGMNGATYSRLESWADYNGALLHDDTNNACGTCNNCNCHHYNVGNGDPAVFIWALQQIQNSVLGCTFNVPSPSQGVLDPDLVTVEYSVNGQPPPEQLVEVNDAGSCTGADDEWYYDNYDVNNMPTTINMCPATCNRIQLDSNAQIQIRIACQGS